VAAALLALAGRWFGGLDGSAFYAVVVMVIPGIAGLGLLARDGERERLAGLIVWSLASIVAAALSGGLSGALAGFIFMPLAVGLALGSEQRAQTGLIGVALAAGVGAVSAQFGGPWTPTPLVAAISTLMVAGAAALGLRLSWRTSEARLIAAETAVGRVETLLSRQPGLTLVLEPSGRVLAAYGAPPPALPVEPLFAQGLIAAVHAPDRPTVMSAIESALAGTETAILFAPRLALDRRVTLILRRFDDPDTGPVDAVPRLIVQAFDATNQHARELGLEAARNEAESQNAGKSRFLANMSHELRTPLNAVIGFSDIMRQRLFGPLPDKYAEYADSIHEAGGHLLDLINDVLDVSKIEAHRYPLSVERFDARDVVSAGIALVRLSANDKGVELAGVLPDEPVEISADRRALKQIMLNLLSNAIKFTPAKGSVTVTLEVIGPYLEIIVSDTGVGVAPADLKRLGRPFEQAGDADQRAQGTGLGLSLVRALAELHGGRMTIDSTLGEGTAVTVRLPVVVAGRAPIPPGGAEIINLTEADPSRNAEA
tara:strand:+ start:89336 stop:90961 length:1626 start_codon:yes stop_codon:yes gene_type:complete